ncbi:unnamed protein product [Acanthosepion pharaonis]|uniref:Uncharacterized protein n=1 Tax=Acanthosepion pharaonis TaxID=158019 RepID=A0A812CL63_ACAPH|nr:unnamed protein product [Sepia pharaonis]
MIIDISNIRSCILHMNGHRYFELITGSTILFFLSFLSVNFSSFSLFLCLPSSFLICYLSSRLFLISSIHPCLSLSLFLLFSPLSLSLSLTNTLFIPLPASLFSPYLNLLSLLLFLLSSRFSLRFFRYFISPFLKPLLFRPLYFFSLHTHFSSLSQPFFKSPLSPIVSYVDCRESNFDKHFISHSLSLSLSIYLFTPPSSPPLSLSLSVFIYI